jgi:hypothetical protein
MSQLSGRAPLVTQGVIEKRWDIAAEKPNDPME